MLRKLIVYPVVCVFIVLACWLSGCRKNESLYSGAGESLRFSTDTVYFDTVFTRLSGSIHPPSVNKNFFIVNKVKERVEVDIFIGGGEQSPFRINVDGVSGKTFQKVSIPSGDSIFCFVEVTLEANQLLHPALVQDSIMFIVNGRSHQVMLAAYGWDATYFRRHVFQQDTAMVDDSRPVVMLDWMFVPPDVTLTLSPNLHFYSAPNAVLYVGGTLRVEGTESQPVIFEGDRLQPRYQELPGQWGGIHFLPESKSHLIRNALIKNAIIGIRVDSLPVNSSPMLTLRQVEVRNCASFGMVGITTHIDAENLLIGRCNSNGFVGFWGGNYHFKQVTIASGYGGGRSSSAFALNNIQRDENDRFVKSYPIQYLIENTIIYGPLDNEIVLDIDSTNQFFPSLFDHTLLKTERYLEKLKVNNNILNRDPRFENPRMSEFGLLPGSPGIGAGKPLSPPINIDLRGKQRATPPHLGALE
jgi:hypothetical protein